MEAKAIPIFEIGEGARALFTTPSIRTVFSNLLVTLGSNASRIEQGSIRADVADGSHNGKVLGLVRNVGAFVHELLDGNSPVVAVHSWAILTRNIRQRQIPKVQTPSNMLEPKI